MTPVTLTEGLHHAAQRGAVLLPDGTRATLHGWPRRGTRARIIIRGRHHFTDMTELELLVCTVCGEPADIHHPDTCPKHTTKDIPTP